MADRQIATAFFMLRHICALCICGVILTAQSQQEPPPSEQAVEVLRVDSDLTQTDVMVFDKQGKFIENLQQAQFELRIDGKKKPITFFEYLKAGSSNEDAQLAAARGVVRSQSPGKLPDSVVPLDRGRTVLFYVDDLHLAPDSITRVRALILRFIDEEFGQNDEAAIASPSGQIGFLQQFSNDKAVLRAAVARIQFRVITGRDNERPPMSEQQALDIGTFKQEVIDFFADRVVADNPGLPREVAVRMVHSRAESLLLQSGSITTRTLSKLESLIRSAAQLPGRKLVFFISDGFLIDDHTASVTSELRRITDAAARSGVVIYSIDARGLTSGSPDATTEMTVDATFRLTRNSQNEIITTQQPLRSLAADTGGRALLNTNALTAAATTALKETAVYYVLAWRPDDKEKDNKFRNIEVSIVGRPDLSVRGRRGFIDRPERTNSNRVETPSPGTEKKLSTQELLLEALKARRPLTALPTSLFVSYADSAKVGTYILTAMEMDTESVLGGSTDLKQTNVVDVGGVIFNDQGKSISSFQKALSYARTTGDTNARRGGLLFMHQAILKPGLYLVRVASRERASGLMGSAAQWIEIPDLTAKRINLSSVVVGENALKVSDAKENSDTDTESIFFSVSRRFSRNSKLRFATNIYNASRSNDGDQLPNVALQVQILRDNQPVLTTALGEVATQGVQDLTRLPYAAEIPLQAIPAGRYVLQVTVIDRIAKTSATRHIRFEVG